MPRTGYGGRDHGYRVLRPAVGRVAHRRWVGVCRCPVVRRGRARPLVLVQPVPAVSTERHPVRRALLVLALAVPASLGCLLVLAAWLAYLVVMIVWVSSVLF